MQTYIVKYKIKTGRLALIREWASVINQRKREAKATLRKEHVFFESAFLDQQKDGWYVIYYMRCEDINLAFQTLYRSTSKIDLYHKDVLPKALEKPIPLEILIDLSLNIGKEGKIKPWCSC
jgi:hypothetical protein